MTRRGQQPEDDPGDEWVARRAAVLRARSQPDDRFVRSVDWHSAYRYNSGQCRCDVCRDAQNEYRRKARQG